MLACKEFLQENDVVDYLRSDFLHSAQVAISDKSVFRVALSGGKTPVPFFQSMAKTALSKTIDWSKVEFYWVDERWVKRDHPDNNFGVAYEQWLRHVRALTYPIDTDQLTPEESAETYARLLAANLGDSLSFDWVLAGAGTDGHTASIFTQPFDSTGISVATTHPVTNQPRVSVTLPVLAKAKKVILLLTGEDKRPLYTRIKNTVNLQPQLPIEFLIQKSKFFEVVTDLHE